MSLLAPSRAGRVYWVLALLIACVIMGAVMLRRASAGSSDYPPTAEFGRALVLEGENVYATRGAGATHTKYPPSFFVLMLPFALPPFLVGAGAFYLVSFVLTLGAAWLAVAAVKAPDAGRPTFREVALPIALSAPLIGTNLMLGQVNLIVLAFVAACLYLASRGRPLAAGAAVMVATALKVTPALLVAGFAWKRGWRVLVGAALGLVLCCGLLPALAVGPARALEATRAWSGVVLGFVERGAGAELLEGEVIGFRHTNQSLDATARRFLADVPAMPATSKRGAVHVNVADLPADAPLLDALVRGAIALLLLALLWLARRPLATTPPLALGIDMSLALVVILAIAPISWNSYFVALLVPYAVALEAARRRPPGDALRRWLRRAVGVACGLSVLGLCPYARAVSVLLLAALLLGAALAALRIAELRAARARGAQTSASR